VEVTGIGLHSIVQELMFPKMASRDEDVLRSVEAWMDDYREALNKGMKDMEDMFKITILKKLVTPRYKERMDLRDYKDFGQAVQEVLKWATIKNRESGQGKSGGHGGDKMDLGQLGSFGNRSDQVDEIYENDDWWNQAEAEEFWMPHPVSGELMAFQSSKGGYKGKGKGQYRPYSYGSKGKGKGEYKGGGGGKDSRKGRPFFGKCDNC
jgi:hypothetical protein